MFTVNTKTHRGPIVQIRAAETRVSLLRKTHATKMSSLFFYCLFMIGLVLAPASVRAEGSRFVIRVLPETSRVVVEGSDTAGRVWSFRDSYAGILGLAGRVDEFTLFDETGNEISNRKIAPGQFASQAAASKFRYQVRMAPPAIATDAARISWLGTERGLLMLADLLPSISIDGVTKLRGPSIFQFVLPSTWTIHSNENSSGPSSFEVRDIDDAVFVLGNRLRANQTTVSGFTLNLIADGDWAFADADAEDLAVRVVKIHRELMGSLPVKQSTLILLPFTGLEGNRWTAETRGATVTLLLGRVPSKTAALIRLSTPLTHELLHLWVPNGLALKGNYYWFSEGFTVYQAARTAMRLDMLTFAEFLNAIAGAYDGYLSAVDRDKWSLVDAAERRWTVGESSVYSKSLLIAFLFDLKLRNQSRGKRSLDDIYRQLCRRFCSTRVDSATLSNEIEGNEAILSLLGSEPSGVEFVNTFIRTPVQIDLAKELGPFGLHVETIGPRTRIEVDSQLTRQQRDLLRQLGYNDNSRSVNRGKKS